MSLVSELTWRGLVNQSTDPELDKKLEENKTPVYIGFDPTASSLHVGSLLQIVLLMRAQRAGHRPIALVGGATGMIGDPSGKSAERNLLGSDDLLRNVAGIQSQLERFLDFSDTKIGAKLVNNADWFVPLTMLGFLRDIGKHFTVNMMMAKDSVRSRLEDRDIGISYTEFSYMLIQAYDCYWLGKHHGCRLQMGGSDQWGYITAGIELIRRLGQGEAFGLTSPLIKTAAGTKFGKTEQGTIWLDAERTSVYDFYQFFLRTDDRDVMLFLRYYSFLDEAAIVGLESAHHKDPGSHTAHRVLAQTVTDLVHGRAARDEVEAAAGKLFGKQPDAFGLVELEQIRGSAPTTEVAVLGAVIDLLVASGLSSSRGAARRDIEGGGIYLNGKKVDSADAIVGVADLIGERFLVLRKGKKSYHVIAVAA